MTTTPDARWPERRTLRIYAFDPMLGRGGDLRVAVDVPYRPLERTERSFFDDRLEVIDYDAATKQFYRAIDLDDPKVAMQLGVEPSEADPQFHQQMVYAVASRVLENFDRALGRRLRFWGGRTLRLFPHAFQGRNAFYEPNLEGVLFGYFPADDDDPGENLPGQLVFTCLSQDIVAHEVTHAALDRLHRYFRDATSPQVPALHEAFADLVALFQRFTYVDVVREMIRQTRGDLLDAGDLLAHIGAQFGAASGLGHALRSAAGPVDPNAFARTSEPHALGRILVEAVFDGFVKTYERRVADLKRIATGGSGRLPDGELLPDLVTRLARQCAKTAQIVLAMCIRATDYLPPVDPSFSDFLRAMVTADHELNRVDALRLRASMIEAFRIRGIRPVSVGSLAVESIMLEPKDRAPDAALAEIAASLLKLGALEMSRNTAPPVRSEPSEELVARRLQRGSTCPNSSSLADQTSELEEPDPHWREISTRLHGWVDRHRAVLQLDADLPIEVAGLHPVHRVAASGELIIEMVAQLVQTRHDAQADLGGLPYRGGTTMVATLDGRIRYVIAKPFSAQRLQAMTDWVAAFDDEVGPAWPSAARPEKRVAAAFASRAMEGRKWR